MYYQMGRMLCLAQLENFDIEAYIFLFLESKDIALDYGLVETEVISFINRSFEGFLSWISD